MPSVMAVRANGVDRPSEPPETSRVVNGSDLERRRSAIANAPFSPKGLAETSRSVRGGLCLASASHSKTSDSSPREQRDALSVVIIERCNSGSEAARPGPRESAKSDSLIGLTYVAKAPERALVMLAEHASSASSSASSLRRLGVVAPYVA